MTSFLIGSHVDRKLHESWQDDCAFCRIIRGDLPAYKVYEDKEVIAILDILPLRPGHTLVIPKLHCSRVSELPSQYAGKVGETISRVAKALTEVLNNSGLNVVANQEYAQAVNHVHYHVIPAPRLNETPSKPTTDPPTRKLMHKLEFQSREELDEDFAKELTEKIRSKLLPSSHL